MTRYVLGASITALCVVAAVAAPSAFARSNALRNATLTITPSSVQPGGLLQVSGDCGDVEPGPGLDAFVFARFTRGGPGAPIDFSRKYPVPTGSFSGTFPIPSNAATGPATLEMSCFAGDAGVSATDPVAFTVAGEPIITTTTSSPATTTTLPGTVLPTSTTAPATTLPPAQPVVDAKVTYTG